GSARTFSWRVTRSFSRRCASRSFTPSRLVPGASGAIAAKGLTGPGYDGHAFWDTETFVLPVLTYTAPHAARDALRWRRGTLEFAQERASALGLKGAAF